MTENTPDIEITAKYYQPWGWTLISGIEKQVKKKVPKRKDFFHTLDRALCRALRKKAGPLHLE